MRIKNKSVVLMTVLMSLNFSINAETDNITELQVIENTAKMINQSDEGLEIKVLADGTEYMDLKGRFQMFSKVKMVDGKQVFVCDGNPDIDHNGHTHATVSTNAGLKRAAK